MADDSPYWKKDEDELTEQEKKLRAEDLSWGVYMERAARDPRRKQWEEAAAKRRSEEHVRQLWREAVQRGMSQRELKPKKNNARRNTWLVVILLGIPSIITLIVGLLAESTAQYEYDPRQGIGIMACILTIIVAFVVAVASGD